LLVCICLRRRDVLSRPAMLGSRPQGASPNNDTVGNGSQQTHHQLVLSTPPAYVSPARMTWFIQRHDPIECGDKVTDNVGPTGMRWQVKTTIEGRKVRWQRQSASAFYLKEWFQRGQIIHWWTPHISKNSARSAGLLSYSPCQDVVRVSGEL